MVKPLTAWQNLRANQKAHWHAYRELHAQIEKAYNRLKDDVQNKSYSRAVEDQQQLLLLIGECNYMLQECIRLRDKRSHR